MPSQLALDIYRGDSYDWKFSLFSDAAKTQPYDLTGAEAKAEVRASSGSPVLATFTCTITLPNQILVHLDATASQTLAATGMWDLQLTWAATDTVKTIVAGAVKVTPDITDSVPVAGVAIVTASAWEQQRRAVS